MYPLAHSKLSGQTDSDIGSAWRDTLDLWRRALGEAPEQTGACCTGIEPCGERGISAVEQDVRQREAIDRSFCGVVCVKDRRSVRVADVVELQA